MNDHEIVLAIRELLDGVEWNADTLEEIAFLLTDNGYCIHDIDNWPLVSTAVR